MRYLVLAISISLAGCATNVKVPFPDIPAEIMTEPKPLKTMRPDLTGSLSDSAPSEFALSQVITTVTENYGICNENFEQVNALRNWIFKQKALNP